MGSLTKEVVNQLRWCCTAVTVKLRKMCKPRVRLDCMWNMRQTEPRAWQVLLCHTCGTVLFCHLVVKSVTVNCNPMICKPDWEVMNENQHRQISVVMVMDSVDKFASVYLANLPIMLHQSFQQFKMMWTSMQQHQWSGSYQNEWAHVKS